MNIYGFGLGYWVISKFLERLVAKIKNEMFIDFVDCECVARSMRMYTQIPTLIHVIDT